MPGAYSEVQVITAYSEEIAPHITSERCAIPKPLESELNVDAELWQEVRYENVFMLNAYYDARYIFRGKNYHYVRIVATVRDTLEARLTCYLWPSTSDDNLNDENHSQPSELNVSARHDSKRSSRPSSENATGLGQQPFIVTAHPVELWVNFWPKGSSVTLYKSYLLSCPVPDELHHRVSAVSVSSQRCDKVKTYLKVNGGSQSASPSPPPAIKPPSDGASHKAPANSLSEGNAPINNHFNIRETIKKDFVVCVKAIDYPNDVSERLVEWIELQLLLGADKVAFYLFHVHPNVTRVLDHYARRNQVELNPLTLPGQLPNDLDERRAFLKDNLWQKRRLELIPYNDCLYKHIASHNYVVLLDTDEAIIPVQKNTWRELLDSIFANDKRAEAIYPSFSAQNTYFFDKFPTNVRTSLKSKTKNDVLLAKTAESIPKRLHMLRHIERSANFSKPGFAVKSFVSTRTTLAVFNHYALFPLYGYMKRNALIARNLAQLNHYRASCPNTMYVECTKNFLAAKTPDTILWKYRDELSKRVDKTWAELSAV